MDELRATSWMLKMMVVYTAIVLGAALADWMLDSAGLYMYTGSLLVAMVCGLMTPMMPRPVADPFLHWRVGAWMGRAVAAPVLAAQAVVFPLLPPWVAVLVQIIAYIAAVLLAARAIDRWAARWSHEQSQEEPECECGGTDDDGGTDGQFGRL